LADTTTPNIKLTNQTEGGNNNTWGTIADTNFETIDNKFGDLTTISTTGGNTMLSDSQEIVAVIQVNGTLVSNSSIIFSGRKGFWIVFNNTSGSFDVTAKVSGQTGVEIPQGGTRLVYCNGTDIADGNTETAVAAEITVDSASTCNILAAESEFIAISGTVTITSFGTGTNRKRFVRATGAFTITHNATTLICPGAQNIDVRSGDTFMVISNASSQCRIYSFQRAAHPPPGLPVGAVCDYAGSAAPTFWLFCYGQTVLRADYPALFAAIGTTHGSTDSTNFKLPDCRGRVKAGLDNMGGTSAARLSAVMTSTTLGAVGGLAEITLTASQMPAHTHSFSATTSSSGSHNHDYSRPASLSTQNLGTDNAIFPQVSYNGFSTLNTSTDGAHTHTVSGTTGSAGSGAAHDNVQPTIMFNTMIYAGA